MFIYRGYDPDFKFRKEEKQFENEYDAEEYAKDKASDYPKYQVIDDETNEIIYSDKIADLEEKAAWDDMFPDEDDLRDNFDSD